MVSREDFLERLREILETDDPLNGAEELRQLGGWDSIAAVSFMALADESCGILVAPKDLRNCTTVNDLLALVNSCFEQPAPSKQT